MESGTTFVYLIRPTRPGFVDSMTSAEEKKVGLHFEYLKALLHVGKVVLAGPCLDGAFGIVILRVETLAEATELMNADPAVVGGIFSAEVHPFKISMADVGDSRP
jgi:uncharacterized protein YciI